MTGGQLSGVRTGRLSLEKKPEEEYALELSRGIYSRWKSQYSLSTFADFEKALQKVATKYRDRSFDETVQKAVGVSTAKSAIPIYFSLHLNNISPVRRKAVESGVRGPAIVFYRKKWYFTEAIASTGGTQVLISSNDKTGFSKHFCALLRHNLRVHKFPIRKDFCRLDHRYSVFHELPIAILVEAGDISSLADLKWLSSPHRRKEWQKAFLGAWDKAWRKPLPKELLEDSVKASIFARDLRYHPVNIVSIPNTTLGLYYRKCRSFLRGFCPYPAPLAPYLKKSFGNPRPKASYREFFSVKPCPAKWVWFAERRGNQIPQGLEGRSPGLYVCRGGKWYASTEVRISKEQAPVLEKKMKTQRILTGK